MQDDDQPPHSARLGHTKQTLDSFEPPFFPDVVVRCSCVSGAEIIWGYRASLSSRTFEYQLSSVLFHTEVSALAY